MNALDVMKYGHRTVLGEVAKLPVANWTDGGVCGVWSTRDILAHLGSYELVLGDVLHSVSDGEPTPYLDIFISTSVAFNDAEVNLRQSQSGAESLAEYERAYDRVAAIALNIPDEKWREVGTIPWYGSGYSLDDLIVYQYYGHKREHCAQIAAFVDRLR